MSNIEKYSKIRREMLSEEFYFESLLEEAYTHEELSSSEMERIQMQCIKLLADKTERCNGGESSSVRIETAQTIMASNLYTIGIYLKSLPSISSAIDIIKSDTISNLYIQGRGVINGKLDIARYLYEFVRRSRIQNPNYTYNATIEEGIGSFFRQYNADYEAHETPASIDYQLMNPVTCFTGVEYIIEYLQNLYMENLFCSSFEATVIHEVMCGYDENYKDLLVNIFNQILINSLGCALLNKDVSSLNIVDSDMRKLESSFENKTQESIYEILKNTVDKVISTLNISSISLKKYIYTGLSESAAGIYFSAGNGTLEKIYVPRIHLENETIRYSMGSKMNNSIYRRIVDEILSCRYSDDKMEIIKEHIKTLADVEDIITDAELSESEAIAVFDMLDDIELAVLIKRHPYHPEIYTIDLSESDIRLREYLNIYQRSMPEIKLKELLKTVQNIEDI